MSRALAEVCCILSAGASARAQVLHCTPPSLSYSKLSDFLRVHDFALAAGRRVFYSGNVIPGRRSEFFIAATRFLGFGRKVFYRGNLAFRPSFFSGQRTVLLYMDFWERNQTKLVFGLRPGFFGFHREAVF